MFILFLLIKISKVFWDVETLKALDEALRLYKHVERRFVEIL